MKNREKKKKSHEVVKKIRVKKNTRIKKKVTKSKKNSPGKKNPSGKKKKKLRGVITICFKKMSSLSDIYNKELSLDNVNNFTMNITENKQLIVTNLLLGRDNVLLRVG